MLKFFENDPKSFWIYSTKGTDYPELEDNIIVDAAVIGGGMAGILSAYLLKESNLTVAVLESDRILKNTTGHTTAKITSQHGIRYINIMKQLGKEMAKQYAEANEGAIGLIHRLTRELSIDCDFKRTSAYVYTQQDKYVEQISEEAEAARILGIKSSFLEDIPLPFKIKGAVKFDDQAQFHPRKFLLPVAEKIPGNGSHIFEKTKAVDIKYNKDYIVHTEKGMKVTATFVIIASHYPFFDGAGLYFSRLYPKRSYIVACMAKDPVPDGMYITAESPTRSLRWQPYENGNLMLVAGENHKTGQDENTLNNYRNLMNYAKNTFGTEDFKFHWSAQDYSTPDGVPYIGNISSSYKNIFVATGFHKWGMSNSAVSAMIFKDLITKGVSPWWEVYNPSRFTPVTSAKNFVVENLNVAEKLIGGKLKAVPEEIDIEKGEGKVIKIDNNKVGAYRDMDGNLHLVDTTCPHLGCELTWNNAEKSWDCPCHGSRFTYKGEIIESPSLKPLKRYEI